MSTFDLDTFLAMPRVAGLAVRPDGQQLVVGVSTPDPDGTRFRTSLYALDPHGGPPRRLTHSVEGEHGARFLPDGRLLFTSKRSDPAAPASERDASAAGLWALPPDGGDPYLVASPSGGVGGVAVAADTGRVLLSTPLHGGADDLETDAEREKARSDRKVTAQLFTSHPVRHWDRWLGPRSTRRFVADVAAADDERPSWTCVTPGVHGPLDETSADLTPDGQTVVTAWWTDPADPRDRALDLVAVDLDEHGAPTEQRTLLSAPRTLHAAPAVSPDGQLVACVRSPLSTPQACADKTIAIVATGGGDPIDVLPGFDRWPTSAVWTADSAALLFTADDDGRTLPFRVEVERLADGTVCGGAVTRLAAEGAWSDLSPARDGTVVYALRSTVGEPPRAVALDPAAADQEPRLIPTPGATSPAAGSVGGSAAPAAGGVREPADVRATAPRGEGEAAPTVRPVPPGRVERVATTADDGARVPGWLVLPPEGEHAGPAPLAVLIHGGPLSSWAGWHWRWSPHVLAARGWAVLLPDPALSTGYGIDYIQRGWGRWGAEPYTDLMALVETVAARDDVDGDRAAALGGSFGGYMANWVAGHTDRFRAIVTHASLWNLEAFHGVTDHGPVWENEFGDRYTEPERYREWSPHRFVDRISTPMLVIHGEQDYRVPVSEGLALWTDLQRHGVEGQYLHLPDENHWVLSPQHARIWYETVLAFLDHHVLGEPLRRPDLL